MSESNKCCEKCNPFVEDELGSGYLGCKTPKCPCHQTPTPSLSEGEGWEKKFDEQFCFTSDDEYKSLCFLGEPLPEQIKDFIRTLLSQTLSNERQRMVAIGEEMIWSEEEKIMEGFPLLYIQGRNAAITTYQTKLSTKK